MKCPECHNLHEYVYNNTCSKCETVHDEFEIKIIKRKGVVCSGCETEISLTPSNSCGNWYQCYKCGELIAVIHNDEVFQPRTLLKTSFNLKNVKNGIKTSNELSIIIVDDDKSLKVLNLLNNVAKGEKSYFNSFRKDAQKAMLLYNNVSVMGYIIWTENNDVIIRQIFILPIFRKKNHGTMLIKEWINKIVVNNYDNFGVESPNSKFHNLLIKNDCFGYEGCFII